MLKLPRLRARVARNGTVSYYFDHGGRPRRWEALGSNEATVRRRYDVLIAQPAPVRGTVDAMLAEFTESVRGKVAPGTFQNYRVYRKHLAAVFDDPTTITQADVLRYLRTCPRMTFRNEISFLSLGFVHWMDAGRLDFNPCFGVRIKRKGSKRTRLLPPDELEAIIGNADERLSVAIELAYATGLRIGDLCALRWADLQATFWTQKTSVPVEIEATDVLAPIIARARALQARVASLYVLCDPRGRKWKTGTLRDHWNAACQAAGVEDAHPHDIRAAAATEVARRFGAEAAQAFLAHQDIRSTLGYLRDRTVTVVRPLQRKA
jgi:integrase